MFIIVTETIKTIMKYSTALCKLNLFAILLLCVGTDRLLASLEMSPYFDSKMVIQRDQPIDVWGSATPSASVSVTLASQTATGVADSTGKWKITLNPMGASGPWTLSIVGDGGSKVFTEVMMGDLWLASGQSNMVWSLSASSEYVELRDNQAISPPLSRARFFKMPSTASMTPMETFSAPSLKWTLGHLVKKDGSIVNNVGALGSNFSAVAYSFARMLHASLDIPLGVVQASAGGTRIEEWMRTETLQSEDPNNTAFQDRDKSLSIIASGGKPSIGDYGVAALYNAGIHPLRYARFKGVVWYQGEANSRPGKNPESYSKLLKGLAADWRNLFRNPELHFVAVQLPNCGYGTKPDEWPIIRDAQADILKVAKTSVVVTIDQGSVVTIHPPNKQKIGERAGWAALQGAYNISVDKSGNAFDGTSPMMQSVTYQGATATVKFGGFQGSLKIVGGSLQGFELAGADGVFVVASAELVDSKTVKVTSSVANPKMIRYLWKSCPQPDVTVSLFSTYHLPAMPFQAIGTIGEKGYSAWLKTFSLEGSLALDTASPANDGVPNLLKYALGLNPLKVTRSKTDGIVAGLPLIEVQGSKLLMIYQKDISKSDILYFPEVSRDLVNWSSSEITETIYSTTGTIQTIRAETAIGEDPKKFMRLKVTR